MEEDTKATEIKIEEDRISMLPDEILGVILSRLSITEATRTSILSSRWTHCYRYFSGILELDGFHIIDLWRNYLSDEKIISFIPKKRDKFVSWVNKVLKSNQSPTLEGLRIGFDMNDFMLDYSSEVDGWVQYAIKKKVKKLELDLKIFPLEEYSLDPHYDIDSQLLNFTSLISLHLKYVDVSGQSLENLLSSCPHLEDLAVKHSQSLTNLKFSMPPSKLKRLAIKRCHNLQTLELNVKSLVSFVLYQRVELNEFYKSIPSVMELSIGFRHFNLAALVRLFPYLSQLKVLKLKFYKFHRPFDQLPQNYKLANVYHLQLLICHMDGREVCFNHYVSVMNACPSLTVLTLRFLDTDPKASTIEFGMKHAYHFLEEVKVVGFSGCSLEVEFIMYIVENADNLKKVMIDTTKLENSEMINSEINWFGNVSNVGYLKAEAKARAREHARDMKTRMPLGIKFSIF